MVVDYLCYKCPTDKAGNHKRIPAERFKEHNYFAHPELKQDFRPNEIIFYSEHARALEGNVAVKVRKFIAKGCIKYVGGGVYVCEPLDGYNKTTYRMQKQGSDWACSCQHFVKEGTMCSHLISLMEFFALKQHYPNVIQ